MSDQSGRSAPGPDDPPSQGAAYERPAADNARGESVSDGSPPRLEPRPLDRPDVDPAQAALFARPSDVDGSFAPDHQDAKPPHVEPTPPASGALAQAFGRPHGNAELLQRPPGVPGPGAGTGPDEPMFWSEQGEHDPWRHPGSGAVLGPPAQAELGKDGEQPGEGPLLSTRELLFGRRVRPSALAALGGFALVLAIVGGFIGRLTVEEGNPLTNPDVTLSQVEPGVNRPPGSVARVASSVVPAVVSVEVHVGGQGGTGSGVMIDGHGYLLTNNHVVSMAADTPNAQVSTVFHDGTRVPAQVVGRDPKTDLAVLKVSVTNPTVAQLGRSSTLAVGDQVIAIGSPLGLSGTVTTGIVSSLNRPVRLAGQGSDTNAVIDAIQTDAAVNPGNSGGALVDSSGAVIGINSAIRTLGAEGEGGSIGLGFAIPIDDARQIAQQLINTGHVSHADLGVNAKSVSDGVSEGAQVQNVRDGSAAATAGLAEGDVITKLGDRRISGADDLIVAVDAHRVGETVPVTVVRAGREFVLNVALK